MPNLDPDIRQHLSIEPIRDAETFFLTSPIRWIDAGESGEDGEMTALSVGTLDGDRRKERVAVLHALATRVATHSSNFRSQRTETPTLPSRPATSNGQPAPQNAPVPNGQAAPQNGSVSKGQAAPQSGAAFLGQAPPQSHPIPNGHITPQSRPTSIQPAPNTDLSAASLHDQPVPGSGPLQHPLANGGPPISKPQNISMPPPPTDMERTKTDFYTPPSDPSELKYLQ